MMGTRKIRRIDWFVVVVAALTAAGCGGGGCGGCAGTETIPGGFPVAKRNPNALQVRVSSGMVAKLEADPAGFLGSVAGGSAMNGVIEFNLPASCGGTVEICCNNGVPQQNCGPLLIDLKTKSPSGAGSEPRLDLTPNQGASSMHVNVHARVRTKNAIPIGAFGLNCNTTINTLPGNTPDLIVNMDLGFPQDATTATTRINASNTSVGIESNDVDLCGLPSFFVSAALSFLRGQIEDQITSAVNDATCKACDSGQVAECASQYATACTDKVCQVGNRCFEELGITGRMRGGNILASISPGTTGALDLYEVLGGYAKTDNGGLSLGMLGGMEPGGTPRDRCGPAATPPAKASILESAFFQGNTRPDTGAAFDVAIGLHKWQLDQFAFGAYDGGFLCLTITGNTFAQLSTDTLSLISRSLANLNEGNSPMAVGLRPQSPPTITLGKNTFMMDAMGNSKLVEPLMDLKFKALELDFFASVNDQFVRVFTVVADVELPIGLQATAMGEIQPVIGEIDNAFTNISVKNSEAVIEDPAQLASLFPTLLNLVLPQLSGAFGAIALPSIGGIDLSVQAITSTPQNVGGTDNTYLSIFANVKLATFAPQIVNTQVSLGDVYRPDPLTMKSPKLWKTSRAPSVQLSYGDEPGLEYSYRIDNGTWSAWATNKTPTIQSSVFWLPAEHTIDVRARKLNAPETIDPTPATLDVDFRGGPKADPKPYFHGQPGQSGCNCQTTSAPEASLFGIVFAIIMIPRRMRRRVKRLGWAAWAAAIAMLPGCSCGSNRCGDADCMSGEVTRGTVGHWTSIAGDDKRVMVATYDQGFGDLVAIDVTDPSKQKFYAVDGVPEDVTPAYEGDYRGGIDEPGENVGAFTSIAMHDHHAMVAYQDRDNKALKFAYENKAGKWTTYTIDENPGQISGQYASLVVDNQGFPAIAYVVSGVDDGMGHRNAELRIIRSSSSDPQSPDTWGAAAVVAAAPASCGGLCGAGQYCIEGMMGETCASESGTCNPTCASDEACIAGSCTASIEEPKVASIGTGTGLFAQLLVMPDNRLAVVYYNYFGKSLEIAVENGAGAGAYTVTPLDGGAVGDRGTWARAVVDAAGTVHIAYQDAIGDQLMYTTFAGAPGTPQLVDDGTRAGDRTHPVGAGATIYLANGTPTIAYQDGLSSDVYIAQKGTPWTVNALASGPILDGFWVSGTTAHGGVTYLAWGTMDPAATPVGTIAVRQP